MGNFRMNSQRMHSEDNNKTSDSSTIEGLRSRISKVDQMLIEANNYSPEG